MTKAGSDCCNLMKIVNLAASWWKKETKAAPLEMLGQCSVTAESRRESEYLSVSGAASLHLAATLAALH